MVFSHLLLGSGVSWESKSQQTKKLKVLNGGLLDQMKFP